MTIRRVNLRQQKIWQKIDFGDLKQPEDSMGEYYKEKDATVKAEVITGLQDGYRVAVLVKDAADSEENPQFRITGQDPANKGKNLYYTIKNASTLANLQDGNRYTNGYLVAAFTNAEETVDLRLTLDQMQLFGEDMSDWVGNYRGTLNFYSKVADLNSIN